MSPAVALFVAVTLAVSAVCIAVRVRVWWRARAAIAAWLTRAARRITPRRHR